MTIFLNQKSIVHCKPCKTHRELPVSQFPQGKTCFHHRKPLFSLQVFPCKPLYLLGIAVYKHQKMRYKNHFCTYCIFANSFRRNYSFLELVFRKLFKGGKYSREETIVFFRFYEWPIMTIMKEFYCLNNDFCKKSIAFSYKKVSFFVLESYLPYFHGKYSFLEVGVRKLFKGRH